MAQGTVAYDLAGPADARPIVLLHGALVTRKMWGPQMAGLSDEFRLIAPDLPGHGTLAGMPFTFDAAVRAVADLIDREAKGRALVVGLSLGGYTAMELGFRHPERTAGLVLADCSREPRGPAAAASHRYAARAVWSPAADWASPLSERVIRFRYPPAIADPIVAAGFYPKGAAEGIAEIFHGRHLSRLDAYPNPILFINGEEDYVFRAGEEEFVRTARSARLEVIPRAAHGSNLDEPSVFNAAVRAFARTLPV
jgi:pimeloyl-ACP methyl ester carboxylesterase